MEDNSHQKIFGKIKCPHCKEESFIGINIPAPFITELLTQEDIINIKNKLILRLDEIKFKDEGEKRLIINRINKENVIYDNSDIEVVLKEISKRQL